MIKLVNTTKAFPGGEVVTTALNKINLEIAAGEYLAVTGPSGCGKTTLLLSIVSAVEQLALPAAEKADHLRALGQVKVAAPLAVEAVDGIVIGGEGHHHAAPRAFRESPRRSGRRALRV